MAREKKNLKNLLLLKNNNIYKGGGVYIFKNVFLPPPYYMIYNMIYNGGPARFKNFSL